MFHFMGRKQGAQSRGYTSRLLNGDDTDIVGGNIGHVETYHVIRLEADLDEILGELVG
jgi:hypothetical protein